MDNVTMINGVLSGILFIAAVVGYRRGFVRQVLELLGLVVAFLLALPLAGALASYLREHSSLPYSPALVIAFLAVFLGAAILFHFLAALAQKVIRMTILGWVDRLSGAVLGLVMGMVLASLLIAVALELPIPQTFRDDIRRSSLSSFLRPVAPRIFDMVLDHGPGRIDFERIFKRSRST